MEEKYMDADRKKYTYENWYRPMYEQNSSIIWNLFDFDHLKKENGYSITLRKEIDFSKFDEEKKRKIKLFIDNNKKLEDNGFSPFRLSGDADYQVYDEKKKKKKEMHMLPNFSLIPITGALNNIKGRKKLSCFLCGSLKEYYEKKDIKNLPYRKMGRKSDSIDVVMQLEKETLKSFFDIFGNIDEYCRNMYFLDFKTILESNEETYWKKRIEIATKKCGICECKMHKDIGLQKYE